MYSDACFCACALGLLTSDHPRSHHANNFRLGRYPCTVRISPPRLTLAQPLSYRQSTLSYTYSGRKAIFLCRGWLLELEAITREIATRVVGGSVGRDDLLCLPVSLQMSDNCELNRKLIHLSTQVICSRDVNTASI